jgi:D-glycero-alpha-D-manno-heptose-7-phosphate kinase
MIFRSKAPLRIGLAGGGTDVSPYCDLYGGAILNATVSLFANASIETIDEKKIIVEALDRNEREEYDWAPQLPVNGVLDLLKGVYNRLQKEGQMPERGFRLSTFVDAPAGIRAWNIFYPCRCCVRSFYRNAEAAFGRL